MQSVGGRESRQTTTNDANSVRRRDARIPAIDVFAAMLRHKRGWFQLKEMVLKSASLVVLRFTVRVS